MNTRVAAGSVVEELSLTTVTGERIAVPDRHRLVHLQFRRFAGCPICHTHLRSFVRRHDEIAEAGIREVVFFHTGRETLTEYAADLPFAIVADPGKRVYADFGVGSGKRAIASAAVLWRVIRDAIPTTLDLIANRIPRPPAKPHGGRLGFPADILIDHTGRVIAAHYGRHAYDHWQVDELLDLAAAERKSV